MVFLNPVVLAMYDRAPLIDALAAIGFTSVECAEDPVKAVLHEYDALLSKGIRCLDMRCPMAVEAAAAFSHPYASVPIEPVLIHCARDVAKQYGDKGLPLFITTPCGALADLGNALFLPNTSFLTWKAFVGRFAPALPPKKKLSKSPVPPGFFHSLSRRVRSLSSRKEIEDFFARPQEPFELIEMLYCPGGCHHGDGV